MSFYTYINVDPNGLIIGTFESTKEAGPEQTELIAVDSYDPSNCGRYYQNGSIGPAPQDGHYWRWDEDTSQFVETPIPTE